MGKDMGSGGAGPDSQRTVGILLDLYDSSLSLASLKITWFSLTLWYIQGSRKSPRHNLNVCPGTGTHARWERAKECLILHMSWELLLGLGTTRSDTTRDTRSLKCGHPRRLLTQRKCLFMCWSCPSILLTLSSHWCLMPSLCCPSPWGWHLPAGICSFFWFCFFCTDKRQGFTLLPSLSWTPTFKPSPWLSWD